MPTIQLTDKRLTNKGKLSLRLVNLGLSSHVETVVCLSKPVQAGG